MKRIILLVAALLPVANTNADPCYAIEPIGYCSPADVLPIPGGPPDGNYCQAFLYHPHGLAQQCLDLSSVEEVSGYKVCTPNSVTVYMDYIWLHEVNGRCLDDDQKLEIPNLMVGSCQQDYIPSGADECGT